MFSFKRTADKMMNAEAQSKVEQEKIARFTDRVKLADMDTKFAVEKQSRENEIKNFLHLNTRLQKYFRHNGVRDKTKFPFPTLTSLSIEHSKDYICTITWARLDDSVNDYLILFSATWDSVLDTWILYFYAKDDNNYELRHFTNNITYSECIATPAPKWWVDLVKQVTPMDMVTQTRT